MSWINAVKQYAEEKGTAFKLPKKDTVEYDAIKVIQDKLKNAIANPIDKSLKKVKPTKIDNPEEIKPQSDPIIPTVQKVRKAPAKKVANVPSIAVEEVPDQPKKPKKIRVTNIKVENVEPIIISEVIVKDIKQPKIPKRAKVDNMIVESVETLIPDVKVPRVKKIVKGKVDTDPRFIILNTPIKVCFD